MKREPTKEQVLNALQTHKTVQKAAKALKLSYPEMQKYLRRYGIVCNHKTKKEAEQRLPWYKRLFKNGE